MEFKTTGQPIKKQAERLTRSAQVMGYTWAARHLGFDNQGSLVSIHQLVSRKKKDGDYGKMTREFLRDPHVFTEGDLQAWRYSYLFTANQIINSIKNNIWPVQLDNCHQYGNCTYLPLCKQNRPFEELDTSDYRVEFWNVLND